MRGKYSTAAGWPLDVGPGGSGRISPVLAALFFWAVWAGSSASRAEPQATFSASELEFFEKQVQPILAEHCLKCHGGRPSIKGGLRLTSRAALLAGGDSGPAVSIEDPGESLLLEAINYAGYEMPPSGKLPQAEIDTLTRWVQGGAAWPADRSVGGHVAESVETRRSPPIDDEARRFWSFQPIRRPQPPEVDHRAWVQNPIDHFVLHRLEQAGLRPAPPADKVQLIRRAYYDLTGLPPEPAEVRAFVLDRAPDAFEKLIDRLLDSPHYGERWGRHWLDLVRYGETNSYERDDAKPFVWRYRDYVIRSFNDDKPYAQFIREQLAGDEISQPNPDSIIATGYYRLGIWQDEPVDAEQELFEDLDDFVRTTGEVFLGLTIGCARCHDHKLDPISQRDYYRFLAFFRNIRRFGERSHESVLDASVRPIAPLDDQLRHAEEVKAHRSAVRQNRAALAAIEERVEANLVGVERDEWKTEAARTEIVARRVGSILTPADLDRYRQLTERRDELRNVKPAGLAQALCVKEHGRIAPPTYVLVRGNAHVRAEEVQPGFPEVLSSADPDLVPPPVEASSTGRRRGLADWIASPNNPLTARVMANRIWQHHFGRGLVRTSSDFGFAGARPTHPLLLDWLASELLAGDWRLKRLHKRIMLSSTYQMSSLGDPLASNQDPTNDLFWRFDMRRLSAEEIRDSVLAVSGNLRKEKMFGPSIYTKIPAEVLAGQSRPGSGWGDSKPEQRARRSIYIHVKRSLVVPMIASFDGPDTDASCPIRFVTTQPTQALGMLNGQFVNEQADVFAGYLRAEAGPDPAAQVKLALQRTLQREPSQIEIERGVHLMETLRSEHGATTRQALQQLCVTMLNLNEFMYLD